MDPVTLAIIMGAIGTVAGIGGDWINRDFNSAENAKNRSFTATQNQMDREFNSAEAQKVRDWETQMSNTAMQRQMADYKAAGLNPLLAATGGLGGAVTPSTAVATSSGSGVGGTAGYQGNSAAQLMNFFSHFIASQSALEANEDRIQAQKDLMLMRHSLYGKGGRGK